MSHKACCIVITSFLLFGGVTGQAHAAVNPVNVTFQGVAIKGYDPVAYFHESEPVKGSKDFSFEWNGAIWYFKDESNKRLFIGEPEKYAPAYGGYCAYAVSQGNIAGINPEAWTIYQDRLYLNYNLKIQNEKWRPNKIELIVKADENWPKLLNS